MVVESVVCMLEVESVVFVESVFCAFKIMHLFIHCFMALDH